MENTNISALDVAKYFLSIANKDGDLISNLKLQKLLYYAQAWYLVNYGVPLFKETIQPWELGPVVKEVWSKFKKFKSSPIIYKSTGQESNFFTKKQLHYLDEFYNAFSKFNAHELVNMTHNESPWKDAYDNKMDGISVEVMKQYYTKVFEDSQNGEKA